MIPNQMIADHQYHGIRFWINVSIQIRYGARMG